MSQMCKNDYESPLTKISRVELEDGICAASVIENGKTDKVSISEQGHGKWDGLGDDIKTEWEGQAPAN